MFFAGETRKLQGGPSVEVSDEVVRVLLVGEGDELHVHSVPVRPCGSGAGQSGAQHANAWSRTRQRLGLTESVATQHLLLRNTRRGLPMPFDALSSGTILDPEQ